MIPAIVIVGAGAWGTALAIHLSRKGTERVTLVARDPLQVVAMVQEGENRRYLPGVPFPKTLVVTGERALARDAELVILATPAAGLQDAVATLADGGVRAPLMWLSKGFIAVPKTPEFPVGVALPHQVIAPRWAEGVGVISGPSFAEEVARGLPTALAVAATSSALAAQVAERVRSDTLRAYETDDLVGVEIGGAVKNVLAIAAGASDGLGFGHNARAALITRGLAETGRLALAMGGLRETMMGLAGLGDLVLTCTSDLSRNRRVGLALARGEPLPRIVEGLGHVAEGIDAARAVVALARHHGVEMPICEAVHRVLYEGLAPRAAVGELLRREPRAE